MRSYTADEIVRQEQALTFDSFSHRDAYGLANAILAVFPNFFADMSPDEGLGIRINMDGLLIFQYLGDGKNEDLWLRRKEATVYLTRHSSLYAWAANRESGAYGELHGDERYVLCGGGFPLVVDGKFRGSICVSGLPHEEDHELLLAGIRHFLQGR